ncbi:MAG: hypothetical protein WD077_03290 [Bacteroidia bacterium]
MTNTIKLSVFAFVFCLHWCYTQAQNEKFYVSQELGITNTGMILTKMALTKAKAKNQLNLAPSIRLKLYIPHFLDSAYFFVTGIELLNTDNSIFIQSRSANFGCLINKDDLLQITYSTVSIPVYIARMVPVNASTALMFATGFEVHFNYNHNYNIYSFLRCPIGFPDAGEALRKIQVFGSLSFTLERQINNRAYIYTSVDGGISLRETLVQNSGDYAPLSYISNTHSYESGIVFGFRYAIY